MNDLATSTSTPVKPSQLRTLLAQAFRAKFPVLISSAPGIGKTSIVEQACVEADADCILMHPVVSDPTDFKGMPWVMDGNATFLPFGDLQELLNAKKLTVCFLDDLGQARPAVQAAAMQLLLARRVNGHRVSEEVVFVAATNRRTDRAGVSGILEPVKSRFGTLIELVPDINDWCAWAVGADIAPEVIAFLRFRPELLSDFQPTADLTNSPSPRTWCQVSKILALDLPRELKVPVIQGAVGVGAAVEFVAFLRIWSDMVSADLVLTAPGTAPIPTEPSALYAVSTAIAMRVQKESMTRYCCYLERLCHEERAEFAALSMKTALAREPGLCNTPGYIRAMSGPLGQLMVGAGS
jgi:ATPase family associated with various cellular activities (AAA)